MNWEAFFLIFVRVGTVLFTVPVFGSRNLPVMARLGLALLLAMVFLPIVAIPKDSLASLLGSQPSVVGARLSAPLPSTPEFVLMVGREVAIGLLVGLVVLLVFAGLEAAGHLIGLQVGFSLANIVNPLTSTNASLLDQFYALLAALIFFAIDGHHQLLRALLRTFEVVPLDRLDLAPFPPQPAFALGAELFAVGLRVSLPMMAALLLADVALAIVARSAPQLNVFVVGLPVKLIAGLGMMLLTLPVAGAIIGRLLGDLDQTITFVLRQL